MVNPKKRFVSLIAMVAFAAIGIMFSCIAEAKDLGKDKQQIAFNDSLQHVLKNAQVSAWPQSVLSYKVITSKMFKPVERQSKSGVKAQMWPFKVEGSGVVLSSVDMGMIKNQQKYAVKVSYTAYAFYNELEEFKVEIGESKILSNRQITDDSTEPLDDKSSESDKLLIDANEAVTKSNYKKAFILLKKGCEQGNDNACLQVKASRGYKKGSESLNLIIDEYNYYRLEAARYLYRQNFDQAIKLYNLAIKLKPNEFRAYYEQSFIFLNRKQYKEAFKNADSVKKFDPLRSYFLRARVLWHQGETKSSINEFAKGCKIKHEADCDNLDDASLNKLFNINYIAFAGEEMQP